MKLNKVLNAIDNFLFFPQPVYSVCLLRIGIGLLALLNWFMIVCDLSSLYGPYGIISLSTSQILGNPMRFSLFDHLPNTMGAVSLVAAINLVAVLCLTIGLFTKPANLIAFMTLASFHHRNGYINNSADAVLRIVLFLLLFTHCADAFSFDRWLKRRLGQAPMKPVEKSPWGLRLIQIQFCVIYLSTFLFKIKGESWVDGKAVYFATHIDEFIRYPLPLLNNLFFVKFFTWATLFIELSLGTLVWIKELRHWILFLGICLHLGIEYTMSIPAFEWTMMVMMIAMIDSNKLASLIQVKSDSIKNLGAEKWLSSKGLNWFRA